MSLQTPSSNPSERPTRSTLPPGISEAQATPPISDRLEAFVRGQEITKFDSVDPAATAFIAAACAHRLDAGSRIWITHPNPRIRERLATELEMWDVHPILFPELPDDNTPAAPETDAQRHSALQWLTRSSKTAKPRAIILAPSSLDDHCPSPDTLQSAEHHINLGDTLDPGTFEKQLLDHNYEKVTQVHAQGQFALRGGIIDLFPWHHTTALRIELFDTEVESLREFDIHSQVSTKRIKTLNYSLGEIQNNSTLRDYLRQTDRLTAIGDTLPDPCHAIITPDGDPTANPLCTGSPLGNFDAGDFVINEARRHRFFQQIADWNAANWHVYLTFSNKGEQERFKELVGDTFFKANHITIIFGDLVQGFTLPDAKIAFLSSSEIFGRYQTTPTRSRKSAIDHQQRARAQTALEDIRSHDLVVHAEYGIGKYQGIEHNEDGLEEIHIQFRDGAILSVPLDHSHLLSKYIGLGGKEPELTKLGTTAWSKARSSAEKSIFDYAAQLLQMQAERQTQSGYAHPPDTRWMWEFENSFHHTLTPGQADAIEDTKRDMESPKPMDRLICGDVGFGKTEVAIRAAFKAVTGGKQAAVLVPTTVLAEQHWRTFRERMSDYPLRIELLNRFRKPSEVRETIKGLADGSVDIVIGTHRLISADVHFKDLGIAIIDEEQRFGVKHKERFKELFCNIDVLTLSATPIPRTLYLSLMGARDMSTIDTPLPGKVPINTSIHGYDERIIRPAIQRELKRGGQIFFLHNRVKSIELVRKRLRELIPEASIVVGHGQMEKDELEVVMRTFVRGKADILLATTIIESGIDIPNANTIIIDRADRFGLADLYQLRGRVGRAGGQAYALLLLPRDLINGDARKRINAIRQYTELGSGFKIAMRDLEIRGAGNLLGTRQSGHIAAVGFDLYCQLLRQTIDRMQKGKASARVELTLRTDFLYFNPGEKPLDPTSNLPAYIPPHYMPAPRLRISAYRELAETISHKELDGIRARWQDRFGKLPPETENLLLVTAIKLTAAKANISSVELREQKLMLTRNGAYIFLTGKRFPRLSQHSPLNKLRETLAMLKSI